jgi:hypothetical protein
VSTREEELETALAEARAERARLWEENQRLRAQQREVEYYEALAAHMAGSVSWKITEPLRTAKRVSMIVRKKLDERRG